MFVKGPLNESLHNWRCEKGKEEFKELMFCSEGVTPLFSKYLLIACYVPGMNWEIGIGIYTLICIKQITRASLVAQWLRIRLPMQGTRVQALVQEDPTCRRATKPMCHNY